MQAQVRQLRQAALVGQHTGSSALLDFKQKGSEGECSRQPCESKAAQLRHPLQDSEPSEASKQISHPDGGRGEGSPSRNRECRQPSRL